MLWSKNNNNVSCFVFVHNIERKLIYSDQIDVSYFAIGILAQLASDNHLDWTYVDDFDMDQMLQQMVCLTKKIHGCSFV